MLFADKPLNRLRRGRSDLTPSKVTHSSPEKKSPKPAKIGRKTVGPRRSYSAKSEGRENTIFYGFHHIIWLYYFCPIFSWVFKPVVPFGKLFSYQRLDSCYEMVTNCSSFLDRFCPLQSFGIIYPFIFSEKCPL